ncbi:MAG: hypothetical protein ACYDBZ_13235 [Steroidobacteraceae bacterium]
MDKRPRLRSTSLILCGLIAAAASISPAWAQHAGGGHAAVGHGGFGHYGGGYGGGYRGGYGGGYRGGWGGGYRGGWGGGYRGGWGGGWGYGWRGGYWGPWGWGGLGLGLYFATLPLYYSTLWWDGIPYYYADNTYYRWNGAVDQYETVSPPPGLQAEEPSAPSELIAYPKNGQNQEQLGKDKFECHRWAASQTGFDPTQASEANAAGGRRADYLRAQAACLEGRGYSVK